MPKPRSKPKSTAPRRLPRGRHALSPDEVTRDQRERLLAAVPRVVAERGYEATSVADIVKAAAVSRNAAPDLPPEALPAPEVEGVIVGGIASRVASEVLQGGGEGLDKLTAPFVEYVLAFYRLAEPGPRQAEVVALEAGQEPAATPLEARRRAG